MENETGTPWISIILLNYNGAEDTIECLQSLLKLEYRHFNIIVVDNHSPDRSLDDIRKWLAEPDVLTGFLPHEVYDKTNLYAQALQYDKAERSLEFIKPSLITTIQAGANHGFASGNNIGIRFALQHYSPDFLWLLNNDTVVAPDSLSHLVEAAVQQAPSLPRIGIWGAKLLYYHQPDTIQALGGKLNLNTLSTCHIAEGSPDGPASNISHLPLDYVVGAAMFVSKTFINEVGLLNEAYFLYFEELDWATRGKEKGFGLQYVWQCRVYHKEGKSAGSSSSGNKKSDLADYHGLRSKIIYFSTHYPQRRLQLKASLLASSIIRLCRRDFKKALQALKLLTSPHSV